MALKTLWLINKNIPLSQWRNEGDDCSDEGYGTFEGWNSEKKLDNVVKIVVNSMSHPEAVELVAREWDFYPPILRIRLSPALNDAAGTRSGNKTKGILRLNKMLGGRVLSKVDEQSVSRDLRVVGGRVVSRQRRVNPAVAGAMRAHAAFALPFDYKTLPPAAKRRIRKRQAKDRRKDKSS